LEPSKGSKQVLPRFRGYDSLAIYALLSIFALAALFPIFWMVSTSFKPRQEWASIPATWFPSTFTLSSYEYLLGSSSNYFEPAFGFVTSNFQFSLASIKPITDNAILSIAAVLLTLLLASPAAYAISRFGSGRSHMLILFMLFGMIPQFAILVAFVIMYSTLRLIDTYLGMMIAYTGFTLPFAVWFMKGFFDGIPREIDEAAITDGCSLFQAFWKAVLPLAKGGLIVTALFMFILDWSDLSFELALVLTNGSIKTIPLRMSELIASSGQLYGPMAALGTIGIIPMFIIGLLIQRHLAGGFTTGAVRRS